MNTENNNLENSIGNESLGAVQTPVDSMPVNNVGEETFSPFQDLNNAPLNVPAETAPVEPVVSETPTSNIDSFNSFMNPEPVQAEVPVENVQPVIEPVQTEPTVAVEPIAEPVAPVQTEPTMDTFQSAPVVEPVQSEPTIDTFEPTPVPEVAPVETPQVVEVAAPAAGMGLNDVITQNTMQMPTVEQSAPVQEGPTLPIPDQMPTTDYQAEVSTPVDYATPMSDFDQIGTTPELDPNAKGKKKSNKLLLGLLLLIIIGGIGYGAYYLINVKGILDNILNSESVKVKNVVAEKNETLSVNIEDYATFKKTSASNCVLDTANVDISKTGSYKFTVTCGKKSYKGTITVKDTKGPEIMVKTNIINAGTTLAPEMLVASANEEATYAYATDDEMSKYQTAGLKIIKIKATDETGNVSTIDVPVVVTSNEFSMGIVSKKVISNDSADANITEKNAILYNNSAGIINDTSYTAYVIQFARSSTYNDVVKGYDNSGTLTYESYSGTPLFISDTYTIILVKDINTDLIKDTFNDTLNSMNNVNGYQAYVVNQIGTNKEYLDFGKI